MKQRKVSQVVTGMRTWDGAGVKLTRVLGQDNVEDFDPFLMLDAFDSTNPEDYIAGFPWHPHRGIETVTYLIEGNIEHGDSIGNKGRITDGCCQWMTAGGGIMHQEMPKSSKHMLGAQLWINLPQKDKMTAPAYNDIQAKDVIKIKEDGVKVAVVSGEYAGKKAAMQGNFVKTTYLDVTIEPGRTWSVKTPEENTVFAYIVLGSLEIDAKRYDNKRAILFDHGDTLSVTAGADGARFLLLSAKPLGESIAWAGPIVMNTNEELNQAFREIEEGTFVKDCKKAHLDFYR
ncbi:MAG: pirin family protein [Victivallales bacterium]|jgi:redox-sensitive bicupin YhaK (pirin superfamily)|nr:pirin family protein [Victivallales bacterium]